ncbi:MAG: DUF4388 domain-containing protein [Myxococcales bacterium]|nr:DUF4388 domain-containing protein [Myxococcales bacterium]
MAKRSSRYRILRRDGTRIEVYQTAELLALLQRGELHPLDRWVTSDGQWPLLKIPGVAAYWQSVMTPIMSRDDLPASPSHASLGQQPVLFFQGRVLPPGEPPSYAGDLMERGYLRLLYLLVVGNKTGRLRISRNKEDIDIFFEEGVPFYVASQRTENRLGELVFRLGMLSRQRLSQAIQSAKIQQEALGQILLREGYLSTRQVRFALSLQLKERLLEGFTWREGRYFFFQEQRLGAEIPTQIDVWSVLKEGVMSCFPLERCQSAVFPLFHHRLARSIHPHLMVEDFAFSRAWVDFHAAITNYDSVAEVMEEGLQGQFFSEEEFVRFLYLLWQTDLLLIREPVLGTKTQRQLDEMEAAICSMRSQSRLERLGLRPGASSSEIRRAYLQQARRFHPDQLPPHTHPRMRSQSEVGFALISQAYRDLSKHAS